MTHLSFSQVLASGSHSTLRMAAGPGGRGSDILGLSRPRFVGSLASQFHATAPKQLVVLDSGECLPKFCLWKVASSASTSDHFCPVPKSMCLSFSCMSSMVCAKQAFATTLQRSPSHQWKVDVCDGIQIDMARFGPASVLGQAVTFTRLKFGQRTLAAAHTWPSQAGSNLSCSRGRAMSFSEAPSNSFMVLFHMTRSLRRHLHCPWCTSPCSMMLYS